jgi:hypothetical protein
MPSIFSIFYLTRRSLAILGIVALLLTSAACNPTWNWRESRSSDAPVSVLLPAKPSSHARTVDLNGLEVTMNMTATEINGASFALGSAAVADPAKREQALQAMQTAMVRNINGVVATEIEAIGRIGKSDEPIVLAARFANSGQWVVQAIVVGPQKNVPREVIDTFLGSLVLR